MKSEYINYNIAGRKRSGFHNHWKAYLFNKGCPSPAPPPTTPATPTPPAPPAPPHPNITYVKLSDIATYNPNTFLFGHNGVITNNSVITNDGNGIIYNYDNGVITNNASIINNNIINSADGMLTCGTATINGLQPITGNPIGILCP